MNETNDEIDRNGPEEDQTSITFKRQIMLGCDGDGKPAEDNCGHGDQSFQHGAGSIYHSA